MMSRDQHETSGKVMSESRETPPNGATPVRLTSLDAYRGLAMALMLGEALHLRKVANALPESSFWSFLADHQTHVEWAGCSLHDLIQPSFTFMVGVSLPFSLASRQARGQSTLRMVLHAFWRALVLVLLGIFLRSLGSDRTYFTFEDTLTQIGLGYGFLFLLGLVRWPFQVAALVVILVGYWGAFAAHPLPPSDFDRDAVGVSAEWAEQHDYDGFAAHWNKNTNLAWKFDTWFLNLFRHTEDDGSGREVEEPFRFNGGGYATLSFIPTLGTMILGLLAGGILKTGTTASRKLLGLIAIAAVCFGIGIALDLSGVCPIVKRIWTPSWTLFSGGWCFVAMAFLYGVMDVVGFKWWAFPLVVVGMNSIVAYCMEWVAVAFVSEALIRHFGDGPFIAFGDAYRPLVLGAATLAVLWLVLYWMYRRKFFVRI
jgi:heparan-alpha-glucosaminide N-acetyltransferase